MVLKMLFSVPTFFTYRWSRSHHYYTLTVHFIGNTYTLINAINQSLQSVQCIKIVQIYSGHQLWLAFTTSISGGRNGLGLGVRG